MIAAIDRIARAQRLHRQALATELGLSMLQMEILVTVGDGPPPRLGVGDLAAELGVSMPTVSDSMAALQRKGLLERRSATSDRRQVEVGLTLDGEMVVAGIRQADSLLHSAVESIPESGSLVESLLAIIDSYRRAGVVSIARTCTSCRYFEPAAEGGTCALLQIRLEPVDLRVNCPEHQSAAAV